MNDPAVIKQKLNDYVREVLELRFSGTLPVADSSAQRLLDSLLEVRQRSDRIEELLAQTTRIRARLQRSREAAKATADDAWDRVIHQERRSAVTRGTDFTGPRERYADANLETLDQRRAAREAEELVSWADEAVDVIRLAHRGLDGLRQEHIVWLRTLQFESHLER